MLALLKVPMRWIGKLLHTNQILKSNQVSKLSARAYFFLIIELDQQPIVYHFHNFCRNISWGK